MVQSEVFELGDAHCRCQFTPLDELLNSTIDKPLDWDLVVNSRKLLRKLILHTKKNSLQLNCVLNQSIHIYI